MNCEVFTLAQLAALTRPCVYLFVRGHELLYAGSSVDGLLRFASSTHHQSEARSQSDRVAVLWFDDGDAARAAEAQIIRHFNPPFNGGKRRRAQYAPRRSNKRVRGGGGLFKMPGSRFYYAQIYVAGKPVRVSTKTDVLAVAEKFLSEMRLS